MFEIEVQSAAAEADGNPEVHPISMPACLALDGHDLAARSHDCAVGDSV